MSRFGDGALEVPLKGVTLKFSSPDAHSENWAEREAFSRDRTESFSQHQATYLIFRIASDSQQRSWLRYIEIMYGRPNLINFTASQRGEQIALKVSYKGLKRAARGPRNPAILRRSFSLEPQYPSEPQLEQDRDHVVEPAAPAHKAIARPVPL
jgi:hypothetical protein